jgi:hypothetical protein
MEWGCGIHDDNGYVERYASFGFGIMALFRWRTMEFTGCTLWMRTHSLDMALGRRISLFKRRIGYIHLESINDQLHTFFELVLPYERGPRH